MSPSGSRKMFPAWSRNSHACYAPVASRMVFRPCGQSITQRTCSHRPRVPIGDRVPTARLCCPYCSPYSSVRVEGLAAGGTCMIDVPTLAEVSTQPCKRKRQTPCLGYCMYKVHGTSCKDLQSAGEGPISFLTHTGARRFSAPYSKSIQGRGQSTSHRTRLPSLIPPPPSVPDYPGRDVSEVVPQPCNVQ